MGHASARDGNYVRSAASKQGGLYGAQSSSGPADYSAAVGVSDRIKEEWKAPENAEWLLVHVDGPIDDEKIKQVREAVGSKSHPQPVIPFIVKRYKNIDDPKLYKNIDECLKLDEENEQTYEENFKVIKLTNSYVTKPLYQKDLICPKPDCHAALAKEKWLEYARQPHVLLTEAIKYLKEKLNKIPMIDYNIEEAVEMCNEIAFTDAVEKEIARKKGRILISRPGRDGAVWDGRSETDNRGVHMRWKRLKDFSFLNSTAIQPEAYHKEVPATTTIVVSDDPSNNAATGIWRDLNEEEDDNEFSSSVQQGGFGSEIEID